MEIKATRSQMTADNVHFNNSITLLTEEMSQREFGTAGCPRKIWDPPNTIRK